MQARVPGVGELGAAVVVAGRGTGEVVGRAGQLRAAVVPVADRGGQLPGGDGDDLPADQRVGGEFHQRAAGERGQ